MLFRALFACLWLSACVPVGPMTAARLAASDPLTADPAAIRLAVILPPGLAVTPDSAVLEFSATRGALRRDERFVLRDVAVPDGVTVPTEGTARVYALSAPDAERMRGVQAEIAGWTEGGAAQGQLGLGIGGCALGAGPAADAVGSVLIRMDATGPFLPLIRAGRLADLLGSEGLAAIAPCQGAE